MSRNNGISRLSAARAVASLFGVLAAIGGATHGVGEVLQGNVRPEGLFVNSWTRGPIATNMGGEPGITVVPNLLVSGVLTLLVSLATLVWAIFFVQKKHGGRILMALSTVMLLVGGGIGPPLIGILAGLAGTGIDAPLSGWRKRLSGGARQTLAMLWPVLFAVAAASGAFLVAGSLILVFFFGLNNAALFLNTFYVTLLSLFMTVLLTPFYDRRDFAPVAGAAD